MTNLEGGPTPTQRLEQEINILATYRTTTGSQLSSALGRVEDSDKAMAQGRVITPWPGISPHPSNVPVFHAARGDLNSILQRTYCRPLRSTFVVAINSQPERQPCSSFETDLNTRFPNGPDSLGPGLHAHTREARIRSPCRSTTNPRSSFLGFSVWDWEEGVCG